MQDKHNSNGFYDLYHNPFTGNSEPRGYTYVAGYGFSPPPRADYERRMIRTYSSGIAIMLLCFLLLSGPVYQLILTLETMLFGQIMTYDGYTAAAEIANMGAYVLALLLPAFLPFNLLKGGLNAAGTFLLYRPLSGALQKSGLVPREESTNKGHFVGIALVAALLLATCILLVLAMQGVI